jgi:hypothetical protein
MQQTLMNLALALLMAVVMSSAYLLDGPSDLQAQLDTASTHSDAQRAAVAVAKFAKAAQAACGSNAGWQTVDGHTVQCLTKRGHKTIVAQVTP